MQPGPGSLEMESGRPFPLCTKIRCRWDMGAPVPGQDESWVLFCWLDTFLPGQRGGQGKSPFGAWSSGVSSCLSLKPLLFFPFKYIKAVFGRREHGEWVAGRGGGKRPFLEVPQPPPHGKHACWLESSRFLWNVFHSPRKSCIRSLLGLGEWTASVPPDHSFLSLNTC